MSCWWSWVPKPPDPQGSTLSARISWDVAAAIGTAWEPGAELVEASLKVAAIVPEEGRGPGDSFAPSVPSADGAEPRDHLLALLGRDPAWRS
ncbi:hypothetical protein GCM10023178_65840 [Actinomadura luteofluorescens]